MNLTHRYSLNLSKKQEQQLTLVMKEAAKLWNNLIAISAASKHTLNAFQLQKEVQSKYNLHSDIITALCQRMWSNIKTARTNNKPAPYKIKELVTITGKKRQLLKNNIITLSKDFKLHLNELNIHNTSYFHITKNNNTFYIYYTTEQPVVKQLQTGITAAIDLGEVNCLATIDTNGNKYIYSGRELRSIKRFRNKEHVFINKQQAKCKKDSIRHKKLESAKVKVSKKTDNKITNFLHHVTTQVVKRFIKDGVDTVLVGDCTGVEKKPNSKNNKQKLHQFQYGKMRNFLGYKTELVGIRYIDQEESWTTQTCPACSCCSKQTGREYKCLTCGFVGHRDSVGCFNTLRKRIDVELSVLTNKDIKFIHPIKVVHNHENISSKLVLLGCAGRSSGLESALMQLPLTV